MSDASFIEAKAPPPIPKKRPGLGGLIFAGVWALIAIGLAAYIVGNWNPALFDTYALPYLEGLGVTVGLVLSSFVCGAVLSLPVALGRMSHNPLARGLAFVFVYFFHVLVGGIRELK